MVAVMGDVFDLVYNFHVPLALKVETVRIVELDAIYFRSLVFLCVGRMAIFGGVKFFSCFLSVGVYFVVPQSWCGVSGLLVEICVFRPHCVVSF
jgi:hypothetical protein